MEEQHSGTISAGCLVAGEQQGQPSDPVLSVVLRQSVVAPFENTSEACHIAELQGLCMVQRETQPGSPSGPERHTSGDALVFAVVDREGTQVQGPSAFEETHGPTGCTMGRTQPRMVLGRIDREEQGLSLVEDRLALTISTYYSQRLLFSEGTLAQAARGPVEKQLAAQLKRAGAEAAAVYRVRRSGGRWGAGPAAADAAAVAR